MFPSGVLNGGHPILRRCLRMSPHSTTSPVPSDLGPRVRLGRALTAVAERDMRLIPLGRSCPASRHPVLRRLSSRTRVPWRSVTVAMGQRLHARS
jgi:hypothetical protein